MSTDLTDHQNARLRDAMDRYCRAEHVRPAELARRIGRSQPTLSDLLGGKKGASRETAERFAELLGKPVDAVIGPKGAVQGERLHVIALSTTAAPVPKHPAFSMHALTFVLNVRRLPGLEDWLVTHPTTMLSVGRLAEAMVAYDALPKGRRGDGSAAAWGRFLAPYLDAEHRAHAK